MDYEITFHENASEDEIKILSDGLDAHVEELFPGKSRTFVSYFVRDKNGQVVGGVTGNYGTFGWLYVSILWVRKDLRGRGYGSELMRRIEDEAIKHSCKNAFLNTMSFQAPEFYKKLGYEVYAELGNFPTEQHSMVYLRKRLV